MIKGVKFVSIPVRDQDRALEFYTKTLGMRVITDSPFDDTQRWIELGIPRADTKVVLFTPSGQEHMIGGDDEHHLRGRRCRGDGGRAQGEGRRVRPGGAEGRLGDGGGLQGSRRKRVRPVVALTVVVSYGLLAGGPLSGIGWPPTVSPP